MADLKISIELDPSILHVVRKAQRKQKNECHCGPSWDFVECALCSAKRVLADHVLDLTTDRDKGPSV